MNAKTCIVFGIMATLAGCAQHSPDGRLGLPSNPHRGAPRAVLNVSGPVIRGRSHRIEFALLGSPRNPKLQRPVVYRFTLLAEDSFYQELAWANPTVSRYFTWTIPGRFTQQLRGRYLTIHVDVCNLAGYTYSGTPLLTEPFTRDVARLRVMHPVAGGNLGRTPHPVL